MSLFREIGGYFELETPKGKPYFIDAIQLNSGRSSLRYLLKALNIKKIHAPNYTCWCVFDVLQEENVEVEFYCIDNNFMPKKEFASNDFILYTNYFGVCGGNVKKLCIKYKNLIVDNAQAFFMPLEFGLGSFNSARKFFGVPDGSYLKSPKTLNEKLERDISYKRSLYLLKRHDMGANSAYNDFQLSEATFELSKNIKMMSNLTSNLLSGIDYEYVKRKRLENFEIYNNALKNTNKLELFLDVDDVPLVYPYLIRKDTLREKLIENKIYVAKYWEPLEDNLFESDFQKYILPLPLDQRYEKNEIERVIDIIKGEVHL